ncbi:MAG: hypothetical protein ACOX3L_12705 [Lutisporaceae bacterium]
MADLVLGLQESLFELGRNILTEVLEDMDEIVGINPHDRVSADVVINAVDEAIDSSGDGAPWIRQGTQWIPRGNTHAGLLLPPISFMGRGTNEQVNGHIRRFIPKGTAIAKYSTEEIGKVQEWLNNYPRKVLQGKSANMVFEKEIRKCA